MRINGFSQEGIWYKGNLHCHSTLSDGRRTKQELLEAYKSRGYSFLAVSDHNTYSTSEECQDRDFLLMPGIEMDTFVTSEVFKVYHIVGVGDPKNQKIKNGEKLESPGWQGIETAQAMLDKLNENGNLPILAHPVWSRNELEDFVDLEGLFGIEIYNHLCELNRHQGFAEIYWDSLLRRGKKSGDLQQMILIKTLMPLVVG